MINDSRRGWLFALGLELGEDVMLRIVERRGGTLIWPPLPKNAERSKLAKEIGLDAVRWLAERYSGEGLPVPNMGGVCVAQARARREYILSQPEASVAELARRTGLTTRRIAQIRNAPPRRPAPLPLFGEE